MAEKMLEGKFEQERELDREQEWQREKEREVRIAAAHEESLRWRRSCDRSRKRLREVPTPAREREP